MCQLEYSKNSTRVSPGPQGVLIHSKLLGCSKLYLATHTARCEAQLRTKLNPKMLNFLDFPFQITEENAVQGRVPRRLRKLLELTYGSTRGA